MSNENQARKVKALLTLANNKGATEAEAARAMELASALMLKYGLEAPSLDEPEAPKVKPTDATRTHGSEDWPQWAARACSLLYGVKMLWCGKPGKVKSEFFFIGREENNEAAMDTYLYLVEQVHAIFDPHLSDGLSFAAKGKFRRDWKLGCAYRLYQRAEEIIKAQNEGKAQLGSSVTAIAIIGHRQRLENEIAEFLEKSFGPLKEGRKSKGRKINHSGAFDAGMIAGNSVNINRAVK